MIKAKKLLRGLLGGLISLHTGTAIADYALNLPRGVTQTSTSVYDLHMIILWVCTVIGVVVFGVMIYSIVNHRKSKGVKPAQFHESTKVEIIWTIVPFLVLVIIAIPATKTLIAMEDPGNYDMTVKITGYQWKWRYSYLDEEIDYFSSLDAESRKAAKMDSETNPESVEQYLLNVDNPLVIPVNKRIRFLLTSADVIHAWWVPEFGWKKDAIPGFINEAWTSVAEPGIYRGQCTELCGRDHGFMPVVVVAKTEDDYQKWVTEQKGAAQGAAQAAAAAADKQWSLEELMAQGEKVYTAACVACHQPTGQGLPGVFPAIAGSPIATGPVEAHIDMAMNGKPGTAMQAFKEQLSDADLASVITYQRNTFGNDTGDSVQPTDIKAAR